MELKKGIGICTDKLQDLLLQILLKFSKTPRTFMIQSVIDESSNIQYSKNLFLYFEFS